MSDQHEGEHMERLTENPTGQWRGEDASILKALYLAEVADTAIDSTTKEAAASKKVWYRGNKFGAKDLKEVFKAAAPGVDSGTFRGGVSIPQDDFLPRARDVAIALQLVNARRAKLRTKFVIESIAGEAIRVTGGASIPVLTGTFATEELPPRESKAILVASNETFNSEIALSSLLGTAARAVAEDQNYEMLNPNAPDSLLRNRENFGSTWSSAEQVLSALRALCDAVPGASHGGVWCMSKASAAFLGTLPATSGTLLFPNCGPGGGEILGMRVLISSALEVTDSPVSQIVALLSPADIVLADQQSVTLAISRSAMIEMSTAPTGSTVVPTAASSYFVSVDQCDATAIRVGVEGSWFGQSDCAAYCTAAW